MRKIKKERSIKRKRRAARGKRLEGRGLATGRRRFLWRGAGAVWRLPANNTRFGIQATSVGLDLVRDVTVFGTSKR